ncbi:GFA family protein [Sinorhizobium sp. BJ1]|uniref:GFA family protein n=1 Tax=Sinorhizobium sp. BJ1 TaxID=2035455 RepID=UPI000BE9B7B9|nr:GFA family protein [Sinorhizobium sp. BJ1]PDT84489.1 aldehyde-activating protein [Sinorhizobium sp. BJ1]
MLRTYSGSCHCGAIRFEADLDISAGTGKCNCSICTKMRLWSARARPKAFRLIAGEEELTDFQGRNPVAHHLFCKRCGIHPFERIDMPNMTGSPYYNINVACLHAVDINELIAAPVTYYDGLNDNWGARPAEVRHL